MMEITEIVRDNIRDLQPYSSARDEYSGDAMVFLDANENPFNPPYNRYPDPFQMQLKQKLSKIKGVPVENIFVGNGSDEAIDLLFRVFCEPGKDNVIGIDPSYGMYRVCADINNVAFQKVSLTEDFELDTKEILKAINPKTKLIFLCSPNNPTANSLDNSEMVVLLKAFQGIVVIDEAYIDFSAQPSMLEYLPEYNNLVVLQTFSKAMGLAGIRLGMAYANETVIGYMNKVKYPYNVNILTQKFGLEALDDEGNKQNVAVLLKQRQYLEDELKKFSFVQKIYPSDANFLLIKVDAARKIYEFLISEKIIIRDRSKVHLCDNALRITIGTEEENKLLLKALTKYK